MYLLFEISQIFIRQQKIITRMINLTDTKIYLNISLKSHFLLERSKLKNQITLRIPLVQVIINEVFLNN